MKLKISLPVQILIALVVGVLFGVFAHEYVKYVSWAGEMFLRFLKMIVVPIVFCSMVTGVASLGNQGGLGRIAGGAERIARFGELCSCGSGHDSGRGSHSRPDRDIGAVCGIGLFSQCFS